MAPATPTAEPPIPAHLPPAVRPFYSYLRQRGLLPRSAQAYAEAVARGLPDPVAALRRLVAARAPIGTVTQARAAVAHWLRWNGDADEHIAATLPPARGRKPDPKRSLSVAALGAYRTLAAKEQENVRPVLLLLPLSGLRLSEAVGLCYAHVVQGEAGAGLHIRGKGDKPRVVPLGGAGTAIVTAQLAALDRYAAAQGLSPAARAALPLFPARPSRPELGPLSGAAVRVAVTRIARLDERLAGLTPHLLRHTYATLTLAAGLDLATLQTVLGHEDIQTTRRYLHPTADQLSAAIGKIAGL